MSDAQNSFTIESFKKEFASELRSLFLSNSEDTNILKCGLIYDVLQSATLLPQVTRLVAYHVQNRAPIGFAALEETTKTLFSFQFLFVNPKYRKRGLGTQLLEAAIRTAKRKKASKVNLTVYPTKTSTIEFYKRYGFDEIGKTSLIQGFLPGFSTSKVIKRVILKQNGLKIEPLKNIFVESSIDSIAEKQLTFEIFKSCMTETWLNFFENGPGNLKNGSRNIWLPHFVKAFVSKNKDSFALLYNQPYPPRDIVELYIKPGVPAQPLLEDLLAILSNRGIGITKLWVFGLTDNLPNEWLEKKQMMAFNFLCLGKALNV